jgi:DNA topoisomerase-1
MAKNLVIVESPAKAKTIQGYLGKDFSVIATVGHLIDLPTNKLGVDLENGYEMIYTTIKGKDKIITDIKKAVKATTGIVYLAQDPDREGESIAWQVADICKFPAKRKSAAQSFTITKDAIRAAIDDTRDVVSIWSKHSNPSCIDRLVGYPLSQLLEKDTIWAIRRSCAICSTSTCCRARRRNSRICSDSVHDVHRYLQR